MKTIKSLRTIKFILPVVAIAFILTAIFAFSKNEQSPTTLQKQSHQKSLTDYFWLKVEPSGEDCEIQAPATQFEQSDSEPVATNPYGCEEVNDICCANGYAEEQMEPVPGTSNPVLYRVKSSELSTPAIVIYREEEGK